MKKVLTIVLQAVVVLIGILIVGLLVWLPLTEGRASGLGLFRIYADSFILYGYVVSIAFFIALYRTFKLLGYIRQNSVCSLDAVKALKSIKYCAVALSGFIIAAGIYIKIFHHKEDDPAGFLAICSAITLVSIIVGIIAAIIEKRLQCALNGNAENP